MLHLMRVIDKATGCVFVPTSDAPQPEGTIEDTSLPSTQRPNAHGLFSSALSEMHGPRSDVRDVQERWVDARDEWDAYERAQWRREGQLVQQQQEETKQKNSIRQRGINMSK